jgi:hypothetical protein
LTEIHTAAQLELLIDVGVDVIDDAVDAGGILVPQILPAISS